MPIGSKQCNSSCLILVCVQVSGSGFFSQTTIRESTEVPKQCFSPASHCHWAAVADGTRNSEFTNKLTSGKHKVPNFAFDVYPRVLLRPRPQKGIFIFSVRQRESTDKNEAEGKANRLFFATG